jgi:phage gpG-like protein
MSVTFISHKQEVLSAEQKARNKALEIIGGKAESYAKKICPVDTGRLRNSITHQQMDEHTEMIGTNVEYAPYVELGHHTSGGTFVAGKHFLRSAAEGHSAEYKQIIENEMKNA